MSNRHPFVTATACALGHKVVSELVDASGRAKTEDVAAALNKEQDSNVWTPELVKLVLLTGAFNVPGKREFHIYKGRYGSIREVDLDATAAQEERARIYAEAARKRRETIAAKKAAKAAKAPATESVPAPAPEATADQPSA